MRGREIDKYYHIVVYFIIIDGVWNSMRRILFKVILVPVTAIVLLLVAAPAMAAVPEMMSEDCGSAPHPGNAPVPACCLTADCLFINCYLSSAGDARALLTGCCFPNNIAVIARPQTDGSSGASPDLIKPPQRDPTNVLPSPLDNEHRCRNCLNSEEPSQV